MLLHWMPEELEEAAKKAQRISKFFRDFAKLTEKAEDPTFKVEATTLINAIGGCLEKTIELNGRFDVLRERVAARAKADAIQAKRQNKPRSTQAKGV